MTRQGLPASLVLLFSTAALSATLRVPSDYETIQDALDQADPGDVVLVAPGLHEGPLEARSLDVTIRGEGPRHFVVVVSDRSAPVVTIPAGTTLVLESLTLSGGYHASSGGGIRAEHGGGVTIDDCVVRDNSSDRGGGIGIVDGGWAVIRGSVIEENQAATRGGGLHLNSSDLLVEDSLIERNAAPDGGGAYGFNVADMTLRRTTIRGNTADVGGGVKLFAGSGPIRIEECTFEANSAQGDGGGLLGTDAGTIYITESRFAENNAAAGGLDGAGGGTLFYGATFVDITATEFEGNFAERGAGVRITGEGSVDITDCVFRENRAGDDELPGYGAGVNYYNGATGQIVNSTFENNSATAEGGGIHMHDADAVLADLLICDNASLAPDLQHGYGGGVFLYNTFSELVDSHICRNAVSRAGGAIYSQGTPFHYGPRPTGSLIARNLIEDNSAEAGGGIESAAYDSLWIEGNLLRNNIADRKGGIGIDASSAAHVIDNRFVGNVATSAITTLGGAGLFTGGSRIEISNNIFAKNSAPAGHGGAIRITMPGAQALVRDNVFTENDADRGGAIFCDSGAAFVMVRNLFVTNRAGTEGGAIILNSPCTGRVENNTIVATEVSAGESAAVSYMGFCDVVFLRNLVSGTTGGVGVRATADQRATLLSRNLFWNNEEGHYRGPVDLSFDIYAPPEFAPNDSLFRLLPESLAIDAGGAGWASGPRDLGWIEYEYPRAPLAAVALDGLPNTISPGDIVVGNLSVTNLSEIQRVVEVTLELAARWPVALDPPIELSLPPAHTTEIELSFTVPVYCPSCDGGLILMTRAWIDGELQAGDADDIWVEP